MRVNCARTHSILMGLTISLYAEGLVTMNCSPALVITHDARRQPLSTCKSLSSLFETQG